MARQSLLEMLLPTPDQIVRSYLTTDENLVLVDRPSTNAFIVEASRQLILFAIIVLVLVAWVGAGGSTMVAALGFIIVDLMIFYLVLRRLQWWYVRYVLTDFRVVHTWGILKRHVAWIPWAKVTDVSMTQSWLGRLLGYATVRIESANEASGFKAVTDLRDPHRFHRVVTEMVQAKQGKTVPPWMKPDTPSGSGPGTGPRRPGPRPDEAVTVPDMPAIIPLPDVGGDPFDD